MISHTVKQKLAEAAAHLESNDLDASYRLVQEVLTEMPDDTDCLSLLSKIMQRWGRFQDAVSILQQLDDCGRADLQMRLDLAVAYRQIGDRSGTIHCRDILLDIIGTYTVNNISILKMAVACCEEVGPQEEILELYRRITALPECDTDDFYRLSRLLCEADRIAEAVDYLNKAVRSNPYFAKYFDQNASQSADQPYDGQKGIKRTSSVVDKILSLQVHEQLEDFLDACIRDAQHPAWIMINRNSVKELIAFCALAEAFLQTHKHRIVLIIAPEHAALAQMYMHRFDQILVAKQEVISMFYDSGFVDPNRFELDYPLGTHMAHFGFALSDFLAQPFQWPERGGIGYMDIARYVFRLKWNARLEPPKILSDWETEARQLANEVGLEMGRAVILFPPHDSALMLPSLFWDALAHQLTENGFKVFTSVPELPSNEGPEIFTVKNTTQINLPIRLVIPFIRLAGRAVMSASEMQFLMNMSGFTGVSMSILLSVPSTVRPDEQNTANSSLLAQSIQYQAPELLVRAPATEFVVPYDASPDVLMRLAVAVANGEVDHPSCFKRYADDGKLFIEENACWLKTLI